MNARATESPGHSPRILVIGYGNELRGDDGAGRKLAEEVEGWGLEEVDTLSVRQLTPDLAAEIAGRPRVVFADATAASEGNTEVKVMGLTIGQTVAARSHHCGPSELLSLAAQLNGRIPDCFLLTIPGECFDWTDKLSPRAADNFLIALEKTRELILPRHSLSEA